MKNRELPGKEYLESLLDYNSETGALTWKKRPKSAFSSNRSYGAFCRVVGQRAGTISRGKYVMQIDGKTVQAYRVIWKIMTGVDPDDDVSIVTKNDNPRDTRWCNLQQQKFGVSMIGKKRKESGSVDNENVMFDKFAGKWALRINNIHFGYFESKNSALEALEKSVLI